MIRFDNWKLTHDGEIIAQQNDNLTRSVTITGDIPEGWSWELLVQVEDAMDIIRQKYGKRAIVFGAVKTEKEEDPLP